MFWFRAYELNENLPKFARSSYLLTRQAYGSSIYYFFLAEASQRFCIFVCKLLNVSATGLDEKIKTAVNIDFSKSKSRMW